MRKNLQKSRGETADYAGAEASLCEGAFEDADYSLEGGAEAPLSLVAAANPANHRIDLALARQVPQFSRARLQHWLDAGRIDVDGKVAGAKSRLFGGEAIVIRPETRLEDAAYAPEAMALEVVAEDESFIVINKPPGLVVHPAAGNWSGTLLNGLLHYRPALAQVPRAGIVHRLDKDTSGLMVVAATLEAQTALVRQLQARTVHRAYLAVAVGKIGKAGMVRAPIGRHPTQRTLMAVLAAEASGAREAITHYKPMRALGTAATLVECRLETGRTHQIRVHLKHLGHPLVGDQQYGTLPSRGWFGRQALHARKLEFEHPATGKLVSFDAAAPDDFEQLLKKLETL